MELISIEELKNNNIQLPDKKYVAFVICNKSIAKTDLIDKMISKNAKELNFFGKWNTIWQNEAQLIFDEYINVISNSSDKEFLCETLDLESFIRWFSICEKENVRSVLFYDDEELKNFILQRAKQRSDASFKREGRAELNAHSNKSANIGVSSPGEIVEIAKLKNLEGIAITDILSTQGFYEVQQASKLLKNKDLNVLCGCEIPVKENYIANALCKNKNGKKALYKLLSAILSDENREAKNWESLLNDNRTDLVIGSGLKGLFNLALENNQEELEKEMSFYDFIEVAPVNCYRIFSKLSSKDAIKNAIKIIINIANKLGKTIVATSNPYYALEEEFLEFSILYNHNNPNNKLQEDINFHIYSTEEMLYEFFWLNDFEQIQDIVINNTRKILDMCEDFEPFDGIVHLPIVENADEKIRELAYDKFHEIYGENEDPFIKERLEKELDIIKENGYASIYYINSEICKVSKEKGYRHGVRGSIGNSLVGFLLGISECNPLPAHTICNKCHKLVWLNTNDGFDKETTQCECGGIAKGDGHNLHFEIFMGINGEKMPDIDLNLHPDINKHIIEIIEKIAPGNKVIKAGDYKCLPHFKAKEIVNEFTDKGEEVLPYNLKDDLVDVLDDVVVGQNFINHGNIIVPNDVDIFEFTPLITINGISYTHNEHYEICKYLYKQDCLDHVDMQTFKVLEENEIDIDKIDITDKELYKFINGDKDYEYGLLGIPEFGTKFTKDLVRKVKPQNFDELVKVSALSHGTNVWNNNQDNLFEHGIPLSKVMATRDDILEFLLEYNVPMSDAYEIAEYVRKGKAATKGFSEEQLYLLEDYGIPSTFVDVCNKIYYMFAKAHAVCYVINALRMIWLKINKPAYFYADYFTNRAEEIDLEIICGTVEEIHKAIINAIDNKSNIETLQIAYEMKKRGITLVCDNVSNNDKQIDFIVNPDNENRIICFKANV